MGWMEMQVGRMRDGCEMGGREAIGDASLGERGMACGFTGIPRAQHHDLKSHPRIAFHLADTTQLSGRQDLNPENFLLPQTQPDVDSGKMRGNPTKQTFFQRHSMGGYGANLELRGIMEKISMEASQNDSIPAPYAPKQGKARHKHPNPPASRIAAVHSVRDQNGISPKPTPAPQHRTFKHQESMGQSLLPIPKSHSRSK